VATADTARLIASLELRDKEFLAGVKRSIGGVGTLEKRIDKLGTIAGRGLSNAARNTERAFIGLGAAAVGGIAGAVKVAGDFEASLNTINTIARTTTTAELNKIGDSIRGIARETGTSLDELTQGYYDLLSAGIKTADAQNVLTAANRLAIGGLASTAETVDLLTTAINTYGGDATKAAAYSDIFAKSVERGKVTAAEIAESFAQVGPVAAASGIEIEELAAGYARLTAAGVPAAEAATQIRSAIVALTRRTGDLEKLEKATGKSYLKIAGKKGLVEALQQLRTDADKAGIPLIDLLGRVEGLGFTLQTTGPNFAAYNADLAAMGQATGTAAAQMAERQQGLNFQLARLKALAKDAGITIGTALIPKLVPLLDKLAKFINAHQGDIARIGSDLAKGLQDAATWASKVDWKTLGAGLQIAASSGKALIDAFLKAPAWVQGFLITGFAANKFTGGALGDIIGELGKGLIKGVLGMTAGVVHIKAGVVNSAGGPGGVPATGGTSKLAKVANLVGKVFIVGLAAEAVVQLASVLGQQSEANKGLVTEFDKQTDKFTGGASLADLKASLAGVDQQIYDLTYGVNKFTAEGFAFGLNIDGVRDAIEKSRRDLVGAIALREGAEFYGKLGTAFTVALKKLGIVGPETGGKSLEDRDAEYATRKAVTDAGNAAALSARRIEAAENRTGELFRSSGGRIVAQLSALQRSFREGVRGIKTATKPQDIGRFAKQIAAAVTGGAGNAKNTASVLASLKAQLGKTHDPKLASILRTAIRQVEAKLPNRQFVARQLAKAEQIAESGRSQVKKVEELKAIQRSLRAKGDTHAAKIVGGLVKTAQKTDAVKQATTTSAARVRAEVSRTTAAARRAGAVTSAAIRNKRWQFTNINNNYNSVSIRDYVVKTAQTNSYGAVAS
jgi:TP901 family phage tail tape measure protein